MNIVEVKAIEPPTVEERVARIERGLESDAEYHAMVRRDRENQTLGFVVGAIYAFVVLWAIRR